MFNEIRMQFRTFRSLKVADNLISVKTEIPWFVNGAYRNHNIRKTVEVINIVSIKI